MAGTIKHSWNGTVLTIESDSGVSSCDLKGSTGDTGIRGPQGIAGDKGELGPAGERGPAGENGVGVPVGGSTGQILTKASDSDYDTKWDAVPALQDLSGTVPLSKGGTGATTFAGAQKALFGAQGGVAEGDDILALPSGFYALPNNTTTAMNAPVTSWSPMLMVMGNRNSDTAGDGYPTGTSVQMYFEWDGTTWVRRRQWSEWSTPIQLLSDADTKPTLSSTNVETVERTQYFYIGNTLVMSGITPEVECANNAVTSYNVWFPKTFSTACVVMASLYYNNDDPNSASKVSAVAGWYRNDTVVIKFSNTSGSTKNLRASWLAIGM